MKTIKLFNAVLVGSPSNELPYISEHGFIIDRSAMYAKDEIINYLLTEKLNGNDLNKSFHKSWHKILTSDNDTLLIEQLIHYITGYGSDFQDELYIPNEVLNIPDLDLKFKVIRGLTREELIERSFELLNSGIALKQETIDDILDVLYEVGYRFTSVDDIQNKEAKTIISLKYNIFPSDPIEFLRVLVFHLTGDSLLIKSPELITEIRIGASEKSPYPLLKQYDITKLAPIFNRFKRLFLAMKVDKNSVKYINKLSKLSKKLHVPMVENPMNMVTTRPLKNDELHWLKNATTFNLFKALNALTARLGGQDTFLYKVRNGKGWLKQAKHTPSDTEIIQIMWYNHDLITHELQNRIDLNGKKFFIPNHIKYTLPTSEKQFIGKIPVGTRIIGQKIVVGIYWENDWGANDLDIAALNIDGKVGWNTSLKSATDDIFHSGDMTDARFGAIEYVHLKKLNHPTLIQNSVWSGNHVGTKFKLIVGMGSDVNQDFVMDPNKVIFDEMTATKARQSIIGMALPLDDGNTELTIMNQGLFDRMVSFGDGIELSSLDAVLQENQHKILLEDIILLLGGEITHTKSKNDEDVIDLSPEELDMDTIINIFK